VPKITISNTIGLNLFFKTAISILLISNHNSFRVLFDKIPSVYFIGKIYIFKFQRWKWPAKGTVSTVPSDVTEETSRRQLKTFLFNCLDN